MGPRMSSQHPVCKHLQMLPINLRSMQGSLSRWVNMKRYKVWKRLRGMPSHDTGSVVWFQPSSFAQTLFRRLLWQRHQPFVSFSSVSYCHLMFIPCDDLLAAAACFFLNYPTISKRTNSCTTFYTFHNHLLIEQVLLPNKYSYQALHLGLNDIVKDTNKILSSAALWSPLIHSPLRISCSPT